MRSYSYKLRRLNLERAALIMIESNSHSINVWLPNR